MIAIAGLDFDATTGELRGPSGTRRLAPQPATALAMLLDAGGKLITRERLMAAIWPGEEFGISDRLTYCLHQLRDALAGVGLLDAVETLPRRGYRLANVVPVAVAATPPRGRPAWSAWPAVAALLLLGIIAGAAPRWLGGAPPGDAHPAHDERHAVRH